MIEIKTGGTRSGAADFGIFVCLLALLLGIPAQAQYGPYVNSNLFVIGLYDYPGAGIPDSHFSDIKNYFNTVDYFCHNANWDTGDALETLTGATLNSAATNGLYITSEMWVTVDPAHDYCDEPAQFVAGSSFYNDLQSLGTYPALLMFANRDEANDYMAATQCVAASTFMGTYGQGKNVWLNLSSIGDLTVSGFQQYVTGATVVSSDDYPDEQGNNLDSEMNAVDKLHAITPVSKMIVLPGYPGARGNILNSNSMSYVTYSCVIHGAAGIWYWGCDQLANTSDPMWQNITIVGSQLKYLQNALVHTGAYKFFDSYTGSWVGSGIGSSGGSGNLEAVVVTNANSDFLITINTSTSAQTYTISSVAGWRGGTHLWYFAGPGGTNDQMLGSSITYGPKQAIIYSSQKILVPPIITQPLMPQTSVTGSTVSFNAGNVSWWPQTYQWYFNGNALSGETAPTLTLNNVQTNNTGNYSVVISNLEGSTTNSTSLVVQAWFGPSATIASDLDVATNGALVYAYDLSGTTATANGVTFTGANSTTALGSDVTLSGVYANYSGYGSSSAPYSGLSSSYQTVVAGGDYANGATAVTVTLNNLTIGRAYAVQLWVNDSRSYGNGRSLTVSSSDGRTLALNYNSTGSDGGVGQYAIGTFTASGTTETFTLVGNNSTQINALQLRDISGCAPITFGPATSIAGDTDVSTAGKLVYAYDLSGTTANVNGVVFMGANSTTALGSDIALSGFDGGNFTGYGAGITNLPANYTNVLTGGDYANGATVVTVTLKNLTVGRAYAVQLWVDDSRSFGFGIGRTITVTSIATNANNVILDYDIGGLGQYAVGTFTASATTQSFTLFGNASTQLNAIQLRDITGSSPITFSEAAAISGDDDVLTNGTPVYAYDLSGTNATVNGITFTGGASTTALGNNISLSGLYGNYSGYGAGITSLSAGYSTVLTGGDYANGANPVTITLNNLVAGHSYAVQLWVDDSRSFGLGRTLNAASVAAGGNSATLMYNITGATGGLGQYTVGTFKAAATTQTFTVVGNSSTQINAIQLLDTSMANQISITGTVRNPNGSVGLTGTGISGYSYVVQFTTNLTPPVLWQNIGTNVASNGQWQFVDTNATNYPAGFYRTLYQP